MATKVKTVGGSSGKVKAKKENVFHQRLASLTYSQACSMLGENGSRLIIEGSRLFCIERERDVFLGGDLLRIRVEDATLPNKVAIVSLTLQSNRQRQLRINCDSCEVACVHMGAALEYLLDSRTELGLAAPPDETVPLEHLTRDELMKRVVADRQKRAQDEAMQVRSASPDQPWTDYVVTSRTSGKTYRVSVQGFEPGQSQCTCPDFRTNQVEVCKHILNVHAKIKKRFNAVQLNTKFKPKRLTLRLSYKDQLGLLFQLPHRADPRVREIVGEACEKPIFDAQDAMTRISALEQMGNSLLIYPDAEAFIQRKLVQLNLQKECQLIRSDVKNHPLVTSLLKAKLLPYQLDGIAFCVGTGRAILADDMGLGKTIQAIGVAELLARLADIKRTLIVCPASLKSQWRSEIQRFSDRSVQIVLGSGAQRAEQYASNSFFTICNYEQVVRDLSAIETTQWDLIVLDEGQRIKNWESKTSNTIRQLESQFRLVLSGTPLENRLGELFTVVRFIDEHLLGPAYDFFHRHHVVDENGKTISYRRLDELRQRLKPILLRRTRSEVAKQLPERTDEIIRIEPTAEQLDISNAQLTVVAQILGKRFITEMDLLRLQKALLLARMACDSTFLIDQQEPEYSSKLERLHELLEGLLEDPTRKIVVFSEWRRMLDRIEGRLEGFGVDWVRLDGAVPQKRRGEIVAKFQNDPNCRAILMTNAGSTGLNLQAANTVINVDLPWNPAILEQRIARAYRMGQKQPVHIYKLVTTGNSIEERMLETLATKQELANAALEMSSDVSEVQMVSGMEDLRRRLEVILTPKQAMIDKSQQERVQQETISLVERRERVSQASGQLISAALSLAGQLIAQTTEKPADPIVVDALTEKLTQCVEADEHGRPQLKITLPDQSSLRGLAEMLSRLMNI